MTAEPNARSRSPRPCFAGGGATGTTAAAAAAAAEVDPPPEPDTLAPAPCDAPDSPTLGVRPRPPELYARVGDADTRRGDWGGGAHLLAALRVRHVRELLRERVLDLLHGELESRDNVRQLGRVCHLALVQDDQLVAQLAEARELCLERDAARATLMPAWSRDDRGGKNLSTRTHSSTHHTALGTKSEAVTGPPFRMLSPSSFISQNGRKRASGGGASTDCPTHT